MNFYRKSCLTLVPAALAGLALWLAAALPAAAQFSSGDREIAGSLCVGTDCVNGESFGFDTIRLKENNLRIKFQDTSNSGSFPTVDWQLTANDSSNGGLNKFSIDDVDAGRTPFTIEANTRSHQLYLADNNKVGFGTATPSVDLHVKQGNTPTLRLEQDGSSGFSAQTWDIAGNEAGFFVRDATNGSQLPLRIIPGADSNSLVIASNNHIGMGAGTSPDAPLHVVNNSAMTLALLEGNGVKLLDLKSTDDNPVQVRMQSDSTNRRFVALNAAGSPQSQVIFGDNEVKIAGTNDSSNLFATFSPAGIITDIGTCTTASPCDAVFDPDVYTVPSIEDHANAMWTNKYLPAIGPTRNGPTNVNAKLTGMINELEHAHIYIDQLNSRVKELEAMVAELK